MAFCFGDGFDSYSVAGDALVGYWDSGTAGGVTLVAGRFAGSQAIQVAGSLNIWLVKSSGQNDAVHHITIAYKQTAAVSGSLLGTYLQLLDGTTGQVCIVFRSDGTILLTSGTPGGTVLATYAAAFSAVNTWYAFEFEVVVNNVSGSFKARKNGNTVDDHSTTGINTRPGANPYANKLQIAQNNTVSAVHLDDILWRSDASSVPWIGDVRCYTRMPASDASTTFARSFATYAQSNAAVSNVPVVNGTARYSPFVPIYNGTVSTVTTVFYSATTCNMKCSIFASSGTAPTAVLGSGTPLALSSALSGTFTLGTPVTVVKGTQYWIGFDSDTSSGSHYIPGGSTGYSSTTPYASFPVASPSVGTITTSPSYTATIALTVNADLVTETIQDGTTTYVYSSNPTDADFYTVAPLAGTPAAVIAVVTRGFLQKSDAGARGAAVQIKSGGTTVASTATLLGTNFGWLYRTDVVDPATGVAWTAAGVNNATIGPVVTS